MESNKERKGMEMIPALAQLDHIEFAKNIITSVKEGVTDPLQLLIFLKRIEKIQETFKEDKEVKEIIKDEAGKHAMDGVKFKYMGADMQVTSTYTRYDCSVCGDPVWDALNAISKDVAQQLKDREAMLKASFPKNPGLGFTSPTIVVDKIPYLEYGDCGEEFKLNQPQKNETIGVKMWLPKS